MGDSKKEKIPFYELPPHIKNPCSKIIEETRRELSSKIRRKPSGEWEILGRDGDWTRSGSESSSSPVPSLPGIPGHYSIGGIRPIQTHRPFTPRDSNLWGKSARKRPPSAITLSRLILSESDESKSLEEVNGPLNNDQKTIDKCKQELKSLNNNNNERSSEMERGFPQNDGPKRKEVRMNASEDLGEIDGLESALSQLESLLNSSDGWSKEKVVDLLRRIKGQIWVLKQDGGENLTKRKLLRTIFRLVERNQNDLDLLFWASFILLHCKITGNNLTTVFKMVFKASRSKEYWAVIKESEYLDVFIESFAQICPCSQTESLIYGYGILKFICTDQGVLHQILQLNLIELMRLHLKILNFEMSKIKQIPEVIFNGAFQLTSILRVVVGEDSFLPLVSSSGLLGELCDSLLWICGDADVVSNIVRILSVVSSDEDCSDSIWRNERLPSASVSILRKFYQNDEISVRIGYCLGNLLANSEEFRNKFFQEKGAFEGVIALTKHFNSRLENESTSLEERSKSDDVLIKAVRILANWSLNPEIGTEISENAEVAQILNSLLENKGISEELLHCVISTLNNTSYYKDQSFYDESSMITAQNLLKSLTHKNVEIRCEAVKVLGNLTRNEYIRECTSSSVKILIEFLTSPNEELVYSTLGVLINVITDDKVKSEFIRLQGIEALIKIFEESEFFLIFTASQLLWNLSVSQGDKPELTTIGLGAKQRERIVKCIEEKLLESDETKRDLGGGGDTGDIEEEEEVQFEEACQAFHSLAQSLLDKLST